MQKFDVFVCVLLTFLIGHRQSEAGRFTNIAIYRLNWPIMVVWCHLPIEKHSKLFRNGFQGCSVNILWQHCQIIHLQCIYRNWVVSYLSSFVVPLRTRKRRKTMCFNKTKHKIYLIYVSTRALKWELIALENIFCRTYRSTSDVVRYVPQNIHESCCFRPLVRVKLSRNSHV